MLREATFWILLRVKLINKCGIWMNEIDGTICSKYRLSISSTGARVRHFRYGKTSVSDTRIKN